MGLAALKSSSSLEIVKAENRHIKDILRMGESFHKYAVLSRFGLQYNKESFAEYIDFMFGNPLTCIFIAEKNGIPIGTLSGLLSPWFLDMSQLVVTENWWWVDEEYRGGSAAFRLLKNLELWGKENGATLMMMVALSGENNESLSKVYKKIGFIEVETHFIKEI